MRNEEDEGITSMKGYPASRQKASLNSSSQAFPKRRGKKKSIVGGIQDRIQNAIKQSQNLRYNKDAIDEFGEMDFQVKKSEVEDTVIEKPIENDEEEELGREQPRLRIRQPGELHKLSGDYKVKLSDKQLKLPDSLPRDNHALLERKFNNEGAERKWKITDSDEESYALKKNSVENIKTPETANYILLEPDLPKEKKTLPPLEPKSEIKQEPKKKLVIKPADFEEVLEEEENAPQLPAKIIPLGEKLKVPDYDTSKKIKAKLSKESLKKKINDDMEEFKDLREEKQKQKRISNKESEQLRANFVKTAVIHKPDIVSEFMKAFSVETKNIADLIDIEERKKEGLFKNKSTKPKSSSKKIEQFTNTLVSQSALMRKLLSKKPNSKKNNAIRNQLAKKFDKLFKYNKTQERAAIKPLRIKKGPKLYLNKPYVVQTKNQNMLYKYDLRDKKYTMHDTSKKKANQHVFPSFWDLLNGSVFLSGGLDKAEDIDPVGKAYIIEGYQSKISHAESMITPRYKHELVFWNKCVYAIGGFTKNKVVTKNVEKYDFQIGEWERLPQMFHERSDFTALASQSSKSIYVFGGWVREEHNLLIEKFDSRWEVWVVLKLQMKFEINKYHHQSIIKEGKEIIEEPKKPKEIEIIKEDTKDTSNDSLDGESQGGSAQSTRIKEDKKETLDLPVPVSAITNPNEGDELSNPPLLLHEKIRTKKNLK